MSALDGTRLVDDLYRHAIEAPSDVDDFFLAEWMEEALTALDHDREAAKAMRAAVRFARKLAAHFSLPRPALPDWRNGVDEVLGTRGWEPQLDLVRHELGRVPTPELFDAVKVRHRAVHFTEWMEGVSFQEWRDGAR